MDATLSELSELVRQVHEAARATGTVFDVSLVAPDSRSAHYRVRNIGLYFDLYLMSSTLCFTFLILVKFNLTIVIKNTASLASLILVLD